MATIEPTLLRLRFLGAPMGTLAYRADVGWHALELERAFIAQGHELSPLHLPLATFAAGPRIFRPNDTPFPGGLPGLLADSLPDAWGNRMLQHELPDVRTLIGKLAAIGQRGPGAITFEPALGAGADQTTTAVPLAELAQDVDRLRATPVALTNEHVNEALARGGSSLGGAQPKASVHLRLDGLHLQREQVLIGGASPEGFSPCILKFARDSDEAEGAVEFAFWLMAQRAKIRVPRACLVHDGVRRHFAVERFDRYRREDGTVGRWHVHSLSGMMHRRAADGALDYEDFIRLSRALGGVPEATECFRRAVFNLLATNRDDHGRNHVFRYDEAARTWTLAPAFDLTPSVFNVLVGLAWLGSMQVPTSFASVLRLAEIGGISAKVARSIFGEVEAATLGGWRSAATEAGVPAPMIRYWEKEMTRQTQALRDDARSQARAPKRK